MIKCDKLVSEKHTEFSTLDDLSQGLNETLPFAWMEAHYNLFDLRRPKEMQHAYTQFCMRGLGGGHTFPPILSETYKNVN